MKNNDTQLIHLILDGDDNAFTELVDKYQKQVHTLVWRKIGDFHIAEEITQDTFMIAYQKLATLKKSQSFSSWLYVIATSLCRMWFRKKYRRKHLMQDMDTTYPENASYSEYVHEENERINTETQRDIVKKLLAKLGESERTVMTLHYFGEMSCAEIGAFIGVSANTVKSRLRRAQQRLQKEEIMIREALDNFKISPNLTESIMQEISHTKPTTPTGGKPIVPLAVAASTLVVVLLILGFGNSKLLTRFQKPYSLDATAEMTVEIVDAPLVANLESKPEVRTVTRNTNILAQLNDPVEKQNDNSTTLSEDTQDAQDAMQWNLPDGAKARFGKGKINEIQYSPDGKILAVATRIGLWLYDTTTYQEISLLTDHKSSVTNITFNPNGSTLASAGKDNPILLWDIHTGTQIRLFAHTGRFVQNILRFSNDGKTLASGNKDTIISWDAITGEHKNTITGLPDHIADFSFSPLGRIIVSVTYDGVVCISDAANGDKIKSFTVEMKEGVFCVGFSPDGKFVAIGGRDGIIYLADIFKGELIRKLTGHDLDIQRLVFSPDGNTLISSCYVDETVRIWNPHTGELMRTITEHTGDLWGLDYSPDGNTFASSGSGDATIRFWDTKTGEQKHQITGHSDYVSSITLHPNGKYIACGYDDGSIRYWDIVTKQHVMTFDRYINTISELVFTLDGKTIIAGVDQGLRIYDANTGKQMFHMTEHEGLTHSIALSPDGKTIASGSEDMTIRLWDIHTGKVKNTLKGHKHRVYGLVYTPDGKMLISGSEDNTIRVWDVIAGKSTKTYTAHTDASELHQGNPLSFEGVKSLALSPDGKTLASGGGDKNIHLWDFETGVKKITFKGHLYPVFTLAFSHDGNLLASGSADGDIRIWDIQTGELKKSLTGHTARVMSLVFNHDSKTLFSTSDDGTVLLWGIIP